MFAQFIVNGIVTGLLYALVAIAFGITYNATRILHIAFAGVLVAAPYFLLFFSEIFKSMPISILLTLLITGLLNMTVEIFLYKPLYKNKNSPETILITSIALFIFIINLLSLLFGNESHGFRSGNTEGSFFGNLFLTGMQARQLVISVVVLILALLILYKSKAGLYLRAMSDDTELFSIFGNNTKRIRRLIYFISGIIAASVSLLLSFEIGFDPYFGMPLFLNGLIALIAGGLGSYMGSVVGGVLLALLQSTSIYFFDTRIESIFTFSILLLLLFFRPQGLFGIKQRVI